MKNGKLFATSFGVGNPNTHSFYCENEYFWVPAQDGVWVNKDTGEEKKGTDFYLVSDDVLHLLRASRMVNPDVNALMTFIDIVRENLSEEDQTELFKMCALYFLSPLEISQVLTESLETQKSLMDSWEHRDFPMYDA